MLVEARLARAYEVARLSKPGDRDDRPRGGVEVAQATDKLVSVHHGDAVVDEGDVGIELLRREQSGGAVIGDPHGISEQLERLADHVHGVGVVLDDQDALEFRLALRA